MGLPSPNLLRIPPTFLCPGDHPLTGVHEIFKFCLQYGGSFSDFLGATGMGFLGGDGRIKGGRVEVRNNEAVYNRFNNSKITG